MGVQQLSASGTRWNPDLLAELLGDDVVPVVDTDDKTPAAVAAAAAPPAASKSSGGGGGSSGQRRLMSLIGTDDSKDSSPKAPSPRVASSQNAGKAALVRQTFPLYPLKPSPSNLHDNRS